MGTLMIRLCSIKSTLPSVYRQHHLRDKLFQIPYCFSVLQAMESWAGPGNEASTQMVPYNMERESYNS